MGSIPPWAYADNERSEPPTITSWDNPRVPQVYIEQAASSAGGVRRSRTKREHADVRARRSFPIAEHRALAPSAASGGPKGRSASTATKACLNLVQAILVVGEDLCGVLVSLRRVATRQQTLSQCQWRDRLQPRREREPLFRVHQFLAQACFYRGSLSGDKVLYPPQGGRLPP